MWLIINRQHLIKLEISPYYEKHNKEYLEKLKRKGIKLSEKELAEKLVTDELIRKLVQQLSKKEKRIKFEGKYYQYSYYAYEPVFNQWGYAFRLVWGCDENNPHILGWLIVIGKINVVNVI